jgi:hypothetical protein
MHIMRRGQAEFALILGIVIVAVFVALYAFSTGYISPGGPALSDEQKAVETYVLDVVDRSAGQMLDYTYRQGGYIIPSEHPDVNFVDDGGRQVAYWQVCDEVTIPDVKGHLEDGMERLLKNTIPEKTDIAGKQVRFTVSDIKVDATIYDESVKFSVVIPTTVDGQALTKPYEVNVPARLGRILSFSTEFAYFQKNHRALDENLMKLLSISDPEADGDCWLPTYVIIMDPFKMDWPDVRDCMQVLIDHTLTHTLFWKWPLVDDEGYVPEEIAHHAYIPQIQLHESGQWIQYEDLDVELFYGGTRALTRSENEFYLMTDPDPMKLKPVPVINVRPYNVKYDVSFPVVVSVHDGTLDKDFRFATFINIRDNVASSTAGCDLSGSVPDEYAENCEGGTRPVDLTVSDSAGHALPGVAVTFNGLCELGQTDGNGKLSGVTVKDNAGTSLELYDSATTSTQTICGVSSSSLASMPIQMPLREPFVMKVNIVEIEKLSGNIFRISGIKSVTDEKVEVDIAREFGACAEPIANIYRNYHYVPVGEGDDMELLEVGPYTNILKDVTENTMAFEVTDNYYVSVVTPGKGNATKSSLTLSQGTFTKDSGRNVIYVYAPKIVSGTYDPENSDADDARISALYTKCKLPPLSVNSRTTYNYAYNPSNALSTGVIGCVYP